MVDPASGLMISHCMLQDHDFEHFLCLGLGEFALGDEVTDAHEQHMYTLAWVLPNIREQFVLKGPKCSSGLIAVPVASREHQGVFMLSSVMVLLSIRDWRACILSPSNMSFSCFQPLLQSSASLVSMSRASRLLRALV